MVNSSRGEGTRRLNLVFVGGQIGNTGEQAAFLQVGGLIVK